MNSDEVSNDVPRIVCEKNAWIIIIRLTYNILFSAKLSAMPFNHYYTLFIEANRNDVTHETTSSFFKQQKIILFILRDFCKIRIGCKKIRITSKC